MGYVEIFCLLFFVTFIFHLIKRPRIGANEPPLVPYRIPIIGHTYSFLFDAENFLQKCREKYGEPFSIYVFGGIITFTGYETSQEVLRNSDVFDFYEAIDRTFPVNAIFMGFKKFHSTRFTARMVVEHISGKLNIYAPRIQKELLFGIEKYFGECEEPKVFKNISLTLSRIIAKPVANVILGEEIAQNDDIVESFSVVENEILNMCLIPPLLSFIHHSLHTMFVLLPFKSRRNPMIRHRDLFVKYCRPTVEKRISERKELGKKYIQKDDLLDYLLSESNYKTDVIDDKYMDDLFGQLYAIVFAAINTTTKSLALALFDYGGRPEFWDEIYEEQLKIHNESNGILSTEDVHKMVKLDCFIKESFRYSTDIAGIPHIMKNDSFTFQNGATIPKGREVYIYMKDTAYSDKFFGETSNEFQPKRHITSYPNGKTVHLPATKIHKSFVNFGGGKHACPGRFFAVNEIKVFFHKLILRYKVRTESGKIVPSRMLSCFALPPNSGLIFENRN
ncbi:cytochrome P450 [Gigaspora rosea]|uniref:Cytochrome P450 n=1 Tax=Gigaspora rosea TaxID=44941 RepID=A0A397TXC6_9GLOM|nr:cytochrome P450 [Gigaspora rosea]